MGQQTFDAAVPGEPGRDIAFTRLTRALQPRVAACAFGLAGRFQALGLGSDLQIRQTPRGLSTFLALVGERGLIGIVDLTLVDGVSRGQGPGVVLDIRLLDGCGDVVAECSAHSLPGLIALEAAALQAQMAAQLERAETAVYVAALAHFELLRPLARHA